MSDDFERDVAFMIEDLRQAMARRRASRVGTDEPRQSWDDIAMALCTNVGAGGPLFGEVIVERLTSPAEPASTPSRAEGA